MPSLQSHSLIAVTEITGFIATGPCRIVMPSRRSSYPWYHSSLRSAKAEIIRTAFMEQGPWPQRHGAKSWIHPPWERRQPVFLKKYGTCSSRMPYTSRMPSIESNFNLALIYKAVSGTIAMLKILAGTRNIKRFVLTFSQILTLCLLVEKRHSCHCRGLEQWRGSCRLRQSLSKNIRGSSIPLHLLLMLQSISWEGCIQIC